VELKLEKKEKFNMKMMKRGNLEGKGMMKDIIELKMTTMKSSIQGLKKSQGNKRNKL
jgi:hypothetical protein